MPPLLLSRQPEDLQGVGDDRQVLRRPQGLDGVVGGGALVHHHRVPLLHQGSGQLGDDQLSLHVGVLPDGVGRRSLPSAAGDRAAVGPLGDPFALQPLQVPADGLLGHAELSAQLAHHDPSRCLEPLRNDLPSLRSQHPAPLLFLSYLTAYTNPNRLSI